MSVCSQSCQKGGENGQSPTDRVTISALCARPGQARGAGLGWGTSGWLPSPSTSPLLGLCPAHMPGGGQSRAETWSLLSDSTVDTRYSGKKWLAPTGETQPAVPISVLPPVTVSLATTISSAGSGTRCLKGLLLQTWWGGLGPSCVLPGD